MSTRGQSAGAARRAPVRQVIAGLRTPQSLRETELTSILDGLPDSVMLVSLDGQVRYINHAFEALLGYASDEIVGRSALDLPTYGGEENLEKSAVLFEQVLSSGISDPIEMDAVAKDGREVSLSFRASLVRDEKGEPSGLVAIIRDIASTKRMQEALRNSEEKLKRYLESSPDVICVVDEKGVISYVNQAIRTVTGHEPGELVGESFLKLPLLAPESKSKPREWEAMKSDGDGTRGQEIELVRKDGNRVLVEVSTLTIAPTGNQGGTEVVGIARDVTERKRGEDERQRLSLELADKNAELEQIVYVASHDLRSPLVNVQGFSKELKYAIQDLTTVFEDEDISDEGRDRVTAILESDVADALGFIETSVSKMDSLLAGLLRFARLGRAALKFEDLDMNHLFADIRKEVEYRLTEVGANMEIGDLPRCNGDMVQMNQLFSNLVDNALKYEDPERQLKIQVAGRCDDGLAVYCVEDNGIGISPEHQARVFEIFHRLDPDTGSGEGLGLSIAKRVVARHSGSIWVESKPGIGSKFFVALPAHRQ